MTWQDKERERYCERLERQWMPNGERLTLPNIIDIYGCVGGIGDEIYLGEQEVREAGLPTSVVFTTDNVLKCSKHVFGTNHRTIRLDWDKVSQCVYTNDKAENTREICGND